MIDVKMALAIAELLGRLSEREFVTREELAEIKANLRHILDVVLVDAERRAA